MKKIFMAIALCLIAVLNFNANAQMLTAKDLEDYSVEHYGDNWKDAAANLVQNVTLDKNGGFTMVQVIPCDSLTKTQLYVMLNYWYSATFNDANAVIKLNDKESGCIIGEGLISGIASQVGGVNTYYFDIRPLIKSDIKDGKVRVTITIPCYEVRMLSGGGVGIAAAFLGTRVQQTWSSTTWLISERYPFVEKGKMPLASSKAFVNMYAYTNVVLDKIETALKSGIIGNENDDW